MNIIEIELADREYPIEILVLQDEDFNAEASRTGNYCPTTIRGSMKEFRNASVVVHRDNILKDRLGIVNSTEMIDMRKYPYPKTKQG